MSKSEKNQRKAQRRRSGRAKQQPYKPSPDPPSPGFYLLGEEAKTRCLDLCNHSLGCFGTRPGTIDTAAEIIDHHLGTALGKFDSVAATQALARTGNDGNLTVIANTHYCISSCDIAFAP